MARTILFKKPQKIWASDGDAVFLFFLVCPAESRVTMHEIFRRMVCVKLVNNGSVEIEDLQSWTE